MDFTLSDDQRELRDLAARIMGDATSDDALREFADTDAAYDEALWRTLANAGLFGLTVSEESGGLGFGMVELGLMLEEQGRTLAPIPLVAAIAMAATAIDRHGSADQKQSWLPGLLSGKTLVTAALEEVGNVDPSMPETAATAQGNGWRLSGAKMAVPYAAQSAAMLVSARTDDGPALFLVDTGCEGVRIDAQVSTNGEPTGLVTLEDVAVPGDAIIGSIEDGATILDDLVMRGQIALSQRQVGIAAEALRRTAEYASERIQFGKPLGSMQAVQQRAADAFIDVEAMRSTALHAAWRVDQNDLKPADVAVAKYWAAMGGHRVVHAAQHLHGGMGADVTYPIHRFFLNAIHVSETLGGASPMLATIGKAVADDLTGPLA